MDTPPLNPYEPDPMDVPEPEDKASVDWLRISQQMRQAIMTRLERGDADRMSIQHLATFFQCIEMTYNADMSALSFSQTLRRARDDDQFEGSYRDDD